MTYNATIHLLCKTGLLALCRHMDDDAQNILGFARTVLQDPIALDISSAMIYSMRGELQKAIDLLQGQALAESPGNDMAKTALGIVLQAAGRHGWRELYGEILSSSSEPDARRVAQEGLRAR
jgi:Bacterial type III secretion protein (HrpB1_HrpK)